MSILIRDQFAKMEKLLAKLLPTAGPGEEEALLGIHTRLQRIFDEQTAIRRSRERLIALKEQTFE
jgi:hypothetical protein